MTLQVSTKFKELILGSSSFKSIFDGGRIRVYSGSPPATADYPPTGTLLGSITNLGLPWVANASAGGLIFAQYGALVSIDPNQNWKLVVATSGTAGWFRLQGASADSDGFSYSAQRIDGTIGLGGTVEITLATTTLTAGQTITLQQFIYTIPPLL